jgi:ribonuclease HI
VLAAEGQRIGTATNNTAEYHALRHGLERALQLGFKDVEIRLDSELVVRQLEGQYRVRHPALIDLKQGIDALLRQFHRTKVLHVPREENQEADRLANEALDRSEE